jgi:hypothetical protein
MVVDEDADLRANLASLGSGALADLRKVLEGPEALPRRLLRQFMSRGSVTERRPGVWRLTVSAGFDDAGNRQRVTRTVKGAWRTAERELTTLLRDLDAGTLAHGRQPLERYLFEEWLPAVSAVSKRGRALAPTTRQRYRDACRHASEVIGKVRLDELRPAHVEKVRDRLLDSGLAPQTVSDVLRVLSQSSLACRVARVRGEERRRPWTREPSHWQAAEVHDDRPEARREDPRGRPGDRPVGHRRAPLARAQPPARGSPRPALGRRRR